MPRSGCRHGCAAQLRAPASRHPGDLLSGARASAERVASLASASIKVHVDS
jgi:hypothetical protein